ncbi:hypothetical protein [Cyclobacterium xiamenense]|uniref:hypothetical protein n=1 Tax=Cyclobacterium xiamenense TaxID=1297121 RepID=UPI0012B724AE|nr:hypothetical protein [Cyclobacterium xiamenense]
MDKRKSRVPNPAIKTTGIIEWEITGDKSCVFSPLCIHRNERYKSVTCTFGRSSFGIHRTARYTYLS